MSFLVMHRDTYNHSKLTDDPINSYKAFLWRYVVDRKYSSETLFHY